MLFSLVFLNRHSADQQRSAAATFYLCEKITNKGFLFFKTVGENMIPRITEWLARKSKSNHTDHLLFCNYDYTSLV